MEGGELKLISSVGSPFGWRARIALNIKAIHDYELLLEDLPYTKSQLLLDSNPVHKKVPVLLHGGKAVCESLIIVEYIDEVWASSGPAILPRDPYDRALARFWAAYIDEKFFPTLRSLMFVKGELTEEVTAPVFASLELLEGALERCGKGGKFFGGDGIGFVDIALGPVGNWMKALEKIKGVELFDPIKTPKLSAWIDAFLEDAAVKEVLPEVEQLIEFAAKLQDRLAKAEADAAAAAPPAS